MNYFDIDNPAKQAGLDHLVGSDEDVEAEVRQDMVDSKAERDSKLLDELGYDAALRDDYFRASEEPAASPEEIREETNRKAETYQAETVKCGQKIIDEYPGLSLDQPIVRICALRLFNENPGLRPIQLARKALEMASSYEGHDPARAKKRFDSHVDERRQRQAKMKTTYLLPPTDR